ncbi:DUF262 domain-containing protein [Mumia sp. zg.B21]|uniref:DUF262 domain-containing protein n=1 Tax=Mumia sp. zg.B21 TaxID=2855447 RepID=UPI001C6F53D1|nr:DUF262 domain-containing protein [Mumia sp. zg.B21]MBW9208635.1 DUF262 domain-containing protein [Mumia sp. zg.B21]
MVGTVVSYPRATSKAQATARMYWLAGVPVQPLGPGSKEKRSALDALAMAVGVDVTTVSGKTEAGRRIADWLGEEWDPSCYSSGDTITLEGLNRLLDAAVLRLARAGGPALVEELVAVPPAPQSHKSKGIRVSQERTDLQQSIAESIAELTDARSIERPLGVAAPVTEIAASSIRFDDGSWRDAVAQVQGWMHLNHDIDIDSGSAHSFDRSLADALGLPVESASDLRILFGRLRERLERAVELRLRFLEDMETAAEGGATLETASQAWEAAWQEASEEAGWTETDDLDAGTGPILAEATTWPIVEFVEYARDGEMDLNPPYQRADVWPTADAQQLIESVLRGIPLPSIIILQMTAADKVTHEVVDGKQRLTSILRFIGWHPDAVALVGKKAAEWGLPDLLDTFQKDYPAFKRLWKKHEPDSLTAQLERVNYFPFPLRGDVKPLRGELEQLQGRYYSQIRHEMITVAGEPRPVSYIFERRGKYTIPVIIYQKVSSAQVHEVFSLYNKQGKHLNAEEIRNATFHELDLMRALLVTAGDSVDVENVAPFLAPHWDDLASTSATLEDYGFPRAGYKRTKLLSWVAAVLFFEGDGRIDSRSTSSRINAFLKRVSEDRRDPMRDPDRVTQAMLLLDHGIDAHAALDRDAWAPRFRNAQGRGKWQELQLVATIIALAAASATLGTELNDVADDATDEIRRASEAWNRPGKTQSKEQWEFIAQVVSELLNILGVDGDDAADELEDVFGSTGLRSLLALAR